MGGNEMNPNLRIEGLPKHPTDFSADDLRKLLEPFGEIKALNLKFNKEGNFSGTGYVCFSKSKDAERAMRFSEQKDALYDMKVYPTVKDVRVKDLDIAPVKSKAEMERDKREQLYNYKMVMKDQTLHVG